jgi:oligopeptide transport system ATP-binding protein
MSGEAADPLLRVENLSTMVDTPEGAWRILDDVSVTIGRREIVGLAGESGSGKSMLGRSILRLPGPMAQITSGRILFDGADLMELDPDGVRRVRGAGIALMPQNYSSALNPVLPIVKQFAMVLKAHGQPGDAKAIGLRLLGDLGTPHPEQMINAYPNQFSGGMLQRAVMALALSCRPKLLIADEPTTALDATTRDRVISLLERLRDELDMSVLIITHDLTTLAGFADRIYVMYAGRAVEHAPTDQLFANPAHPYARALLASIPRIHHRGRELVSIPGLPPEFSKLGQACRFAPRCPHAAPLCNERYPEAFAVGGEASTGHWAECWLTGGKISDKVGPGLAASMGNQP